MSVSSSAIRRRLPAYLLFGVACCANVYPVGRDFNSALKINQQIITQIHADSFARSRVRGLKGDSEVEQIGQP